MKEKRDFIHLLLDKKSMLIKIYFFGDLGERCET